MNMTAKLLVVDDEPRTAELTAELLRRAGYVVEIAGSGTAALQSVHTSSPDLMLLDYEMPDMEAPEVLDLLRSGADRVDRSCLRRCRRGCDDDPCTTQSTDKRHLILLAGRRHCRHPVRKIRGKALEQTTGW